MFRAICFVWSPHSTAVHQYLQEIKSTCSHTGLIRYRQAIHLASVLEPRWIHETLAGLNLRPPFYLPN